MSNEVLAMIQIGSVLTYIGVAFALYRILVQQKDANIAFLKDQLEAAKAQSPDALLARFQARIQAMQGEIDRLAVDSSSRHELEMKAARLAEYEEVADRVATDMRTVRNKLRLEMQRELEARRSRPPDTP